MKEGKKMIKRAIALIADLHSGHKMALFPEQWTDKNGNVFKAKKGHKELLKNWKHFCNECDKFEVDTIINIGDTIEGTNRKQFGADLFTSNLNEQVDITVELQKMIVNKSRDYYLFEGSGYHGSLDYKIADAVVDKIRPFSKSAAVVDPVQYFKIKGTELVVYGQHGAGGSLMYHSGKLERDIKAHMLREATGQLPRAKLFINAHFHFYDCVQIMGRVSVQCPCWKVFDANPITLKNPARFQPDIGAVILLIDEQEKIAVLPYIYKTKETKTINTIEI